MASNIYEFTGKITNKKAKKVYSKKSNYHGNIYYRLQVELESKPELKEILVFQSSKVWKAIKGSEYIDKKYLFYCSPKISNYQIVSYQLVDWKLLDNYGEKK